MELPKIVSNPNVMVGKPCIQGTRVTVELLLEKLAAGHDAERIYRAHPHLPTGSVEAALQYAAAVMRNDINVPLVFQKSA